MKFVLKESDFTYSQEEIQRTIRNIIDVYNNLEEVCQVLRQQLADAGAADLASDVNSYFLNDLEDERENIEKYVKWLDDDVVKFFNPEDEEGDEEV